MEENIFCVYRHITKDTHETFYIGIGKEDRPYKKYKSNRTKYWHNIVNKHDYIIEVLLEDLLWQEACDIEKELIKWFGRRDLGTGTLVNMTNGGDGVYGIKFSEETLNKIRTLRVGSKLSPEHINSLIKSNTGRIISKETREKLSKNNRKKDIPLGIVKKIKVINTITNQVYNSMQECARMENINYSTLQRRIKGSVVTPTHFKLIDHGN